MWRKVEERGAHQVAKTKRPAPEEGSSPLGGRDDCEPHSVVLEPNPGPLKEQLVLTAAALPLRLID